MPLAQSIETRFYDKTMPSSNGCLLWAGATDGRGYGKFSIDGSSRRAHRVAWELAHGPIADGLYVCHRCDVRNCVALDHLFLGTHEENMADMKAKGRSWTDRPRGERCRRGHSAEDYVTCPSGQRYCRACRRDRRAA